MHGGKIRESKARVKRDLGGGTGLQDTAKPDGVVATAENLRHAAGRMTAEPENPIKATP